MERHDVPGNRNILFLIIGALIVVVGVLGYNLYQTKKHRMDYRSTSVPMD